MSTVDAASTGVAGGAVERNLNARQRLLWSMYDFSPGRGLEIGPLHQPIVLPEHADVSYVDVFDRDGLCDHYREDPGVPLDQIPEVDFPLFDGERVRTIPEAIGDRSGFDWIMASHVVEHVPDLIGWLRQLADVTKDGGDLVLAVPDRRYCFDLHRPGTTVGQMMQAHELGETVPSIRAVYDYTRGHASVRAPMVWDGEPVGYENRIHSLELVLERVEKAREGIYIDSHVWTFTPGTFLETIIELRTLGLCDWKVSLLVPTPRNQLEFYAVLTRLPRDREWTPDLFADEPQPGRMPDWLAEWATLRRELKEAATEVAQLRGRVAEVEAERAALHVTLKGTRAKHDKRVEQLRADLSVVQGREKKRLTSRLKANVRRRPGGKALARLYSAGRRRLQR